MERSLKSGQRVLQQIRTKGLALYNYHTQNELLTLASESKHSNVHRRAAGFITYYHERGSIEYIVGEKANRFMVPYLHLEIPESIQEIKGLPVSRGIVQGKVKILHSPKELGKLNEGEILVAPMTSPDFIVAMRKAVGIITDEGGMTSHAAIVARELGIPCVVGTRIATRVLKDGDVVEMDASNGIIRLLRQKT